jgi:hypothetical protein
MTGLLRYRVVVARSRNCGGVILTQHPGTSSKEDGEDGEEVSEVSKVSEELTAEDAEAAEVR